MKVNRCGDAETSGSLVFKSTTYEWVLENLEDTKKLGYELAKNLPSKSILLLQGPLGVGKTTIVQGLAKGLGIVEPVTSPTFSLAQHYKIGKQNLIHLDLYRIENNYADELFLQEEEEADSENSIIVIEWAERLNIELPEAWLIKINYGTDNRRLVNLFKRI